MAGDGHSVPLSELAIRITKGTTPTTLGRPFTEDGVNFLKSESIKDGRIDESSFAFIDDETHDALRRSKLEEGDVVFSMAGVYLGKTAVVTRSILPANTNQAVGIIRLDQEKADPRFIHYVLSSSECRSWVYRSGAQSAQPNFNLRDIGELQIPSLPLSEQRAIAHVLGTFDDKIELNRRMNETLEAIARALFKSWFIDFDPVRAKASGRDPNLPKHIADLFPDSFEDSELGEIPKGWTVCFIGEICQRIAMGPFGSDIKTDNFINFGVPVVRGSNLTNGFVEESFVFVSETKADQLRNANAFPGDLVLTHRGTLGQVGLIPEQSRFPRYVVSQSQMLLSVKKDVATPQYVYEFLRSSAGQHALLANTSQTGVPAISRPTTSLRAIQLLLPPIVILRSFNAVVESLYRRRDQNTEEVRTLTALRDTLLPKLISGEVRTFRRLCDDQPNQFGVD